MTTTTTEREDLKIAFGMTKDAVNRRHDPSAVIARHYQSGFGFSGEGYHRLPRKKPGPKPHVEDPPTTMQCPCCLESVRAVNKKFLEITEDGFQLHRHSPGQGTKEVNASKRHGYHRAVNKKPGDNP